MNFICIPEGQCRVKLLNSVPNSLDILYMAAKTCVSSKSMKEMEQNYLYINWGVDNEEHDSDERKIEKVCKLVSMKHLSVLEHMPLTFSVSDVSRALLAQYSRHRIGVSLSVQSQRYVKIKEDNRPHVIIPTEFMDNEMVRSAFTNNVWQALDAYQDLIKRGATPQDARSVLPSCMATQFITTLNLRSLLDLYEKRVLTPGAQEEIKSMVALFMRETILNYSWVAPVCYVLYQERELDIYRMADDITMPFKHLEKDIYRKYRQ